MPSPTDKTWPTSETSASWPKFLICSFPGILVRMVGGAGQPSPGAPPPRNNTPADGGGLDLDVEVDFLAAGHRFERVPERVEILVAERLGDGGFRGDFAL